MCAAEGEHRPSVDEDARFFFQRFLECFRWQTRYARQTSENFRSFGVHFLHERIILWHGRRGRDRVTRERFHVFELQKWIERPLVADRAAEAIANFGATWRTAGVPRIDNDAVR